MAAATTQTISLRVPTTLLEQIDQSAEHAGETRNTYVLSWLPDYYDQAARNPKP
jgi:uncharacterized protein (DUF1778 family)